VADTKISGLPAATVAAVANELAINEAGTSKKLSVQLLADLFYKRISGNTGTAGSYETYQVLTSNATANATVTLATVMTTTLPSAGTWFFDYYVIYQSSVTTTGVNFAIDYSGTVTRTRMTRIGQTTLATAVNGIADQTISAVTGGTAQAWAGRTDAAALGPSAGVGVVNVDQYERIFGTIVVSTAANLLLQHASETANSTQVMADTALFLRKVA
jgi:hypothetical protein